MLRKFAILFWGAFTAFNAVAFFLSGGMLAFIGLTLVGAVVFAIAWTDNLNLIPGDVATETYRMRVMMEEMMKEQNKERNNR